METKFKAICLDLDGTLLKEKAVISDANKEVLLDAIAQGIHVFIVSGRPYCFAKYCANLISDKVKVIASNGGVYEQGEAIIEHKIDTNELKKVADFLKEGKVHSFFKGKEYIYTHDAYDSRFVYDHMQELELFPYTKSFNELGWDLLVEQMQGIVKILVFDFDKENLKNVKDKIESECNVSVSSYNDISFDVNALQVNKGNAIVSVLKYYRIEYKDVICFGDANNDLPMFEVCGHKVAMANATQEVLDKADEITLSNKEDGVAHTLRNYII